MHTDGQCGRWVITIASVHSTILSIDRSLTFIAAAPHSPASPRLGSLGSPRLIDPRRLHLRSHQHVVHQRQHIRAIRIRRHRRSRTTHRPRRPRPRAGPIAALCCSRRRRGTPLPLQEPRRGRWPIPIPIPMLPIPMIGVPIAPPARPPLPRTPPTRANQVRPAQRGQQRARLRCGGGGDARRGAGGGGGGVGVSACVGVWGCAVGVRCCGGAGEGLAGEGLGKTAGGDGGDGGDGVSGRMGCRLVCDCEQSQRCCCYRGAFRPACACKAVSHLVCVQHSHSHTRTHIHTSCACEIPQSHY